MSERRTLPQRKNRGQKFVIQREEEKKGEQQMVIHKKNRNKSNRAAKEPESVSDRCSKTELDQEIDEIQKKNNYVNLNKVSFPYPRGCHYFYDLLTFERVEGSPSYANIQKDSFEQTFSRDIQEIKGQKIGQILNRKYFQLPFNTPRIKKIRTHNICHGYLFNSEDKKYIIDKTLLQLKHIRKNLKSLLQTGKIQQFSIIKKENTLNVILQPSLSLTFQQKLQILDEKIQNMLRRKNNLKENSQKQDELYFYHSLDQKLHDSIFQNEERTNWNNLIYQLNLKNIMRKSIFDNPGEKTRKIEKNKIKPFFMYTHTKKQKYVFSQKMLQVIIDKIGKNLQKIKEDGNYLINIPQVFFNFSNFDVFQMAENVVIHRLFNTSEAAFYSCKKIWQKIFGRKLKIKKQPKSFTKTEYQKLLNNTLGPLKKHFEPKKADEEYSGEEIIAYPSLDAFANLNLGPKKQQLTFILPKQGCKQIELGEYIVLSIFHCVYLAIGEIFSFAKKNRGILDLIGSQLYSKYHISLVQAVGKPQFGALEQTIKKLMECVMKPQIGCSETLFWMFQQSTRVGYLIKIMNITEVQMNKKLEEQKQALDNIPKKRK